MSTPPAPRTRATILRYWQARAAAEGRLSMIAVPIRQQPRFEVGKVEASNDGSYFTFYSREVERKSYKFWSVDHYEHRTKGEPVQCQGMPAPFRVGDVLACKEAWGAMRNGRIYKASFDKEDDNGLIAWASARSMPADFVRFHFAVKSIAAKRATDITQDEALTCGAHLDDFLSSPSLRVFWDRDYPAFPFASSPWIWLAGVERIGGAR